MDIIATDGPDRVVVANGRIIETYEKGRLVSVYSLKSFKPTYSRKSKKEKK